LLLKSEIQKHCHVLIARAFNACNPVSLLYLLW
jgi:hypothetical protein